MSEDRNAATAERSRTPGVRRMPSQQRSRERVERILDAATKLIAAQGSDAIRMSEVAETAGVPIGSLYQYFPDKSAILLTLSERYNDACRHCIEEELARVRTLSDLEMAFGSLLDTYFTLFTEDPAMRDVLSGVDADKRLQEIEIAHSRANATFLADAIERVGSTVGRNAIDVAAFLIMHLGESTMRLAVSVDEEEGALIVDAYKRMALGELARLCSPPSDRRTKVGL